MVKKNKMFQGVCRRPIEMWLHLDFLLTTSVRRNNRLFWKFVRVIKRCESIWGFSWQLWLEGNKNRRLFRDVFNDHKEIWVKREFSVSYLSLLKASRAVWMQGRTFSLQLSWFLSWRRPWDPSFWSPSVENVISKLDKWWNIFISRGRYKLAQIRFIECPSLSLLPHKNPNKNKLPLPVTTKLLAGIFLLEGFSSKPWMCSR